MYDLIIIGGGPGGYVSAERAGARGKSVLLIEEQHLGGICLNAGCIPTKTLLHSAKSYVAALEGSRFGVTAENVRFDLSAALKWKDTAVTNLRKGIDSSMKRHGVEMLTGHAELVDRQTIRVGESEYQAHNILLATGSEPARPPIPGLESDHVLTSRQLLEKQELPEHLVVIGGGYIGMEFASLFSAVGVKVTVIEMMEEIIPFMDSDLAATLRKSLSKVEFVLGASVESVDGATVTYRKDGAQQRVEADTILLAVGRKPRTEGTGIERIGVEVDDKGVRIDEQMRTNIPGVYAAGDCTGRALLAHAASRMGEVAVADMFGSEEERQSNRMRYRAVPWVVFTHPEVAGCGMSRAEAEQAGYRVKTAELTMKASGRYLAEHPRERGTCRVVADTDTNRILGVQMLGTGSSELIFGAATIIEAELRVQDVREVIYPHPTVSEVLRDTIWELEE
jgi:dihydrolipoamide dehydrogenase